MVDYELKNRIIMKEIFSSFRGTENELIPILQHVQEHFGYLPESAMLEVARFISVSESKVYATASFYSQFRFKATGKKHITVCQGTACHVRGAGKIQDTLERQLGIKEGETTADQEYSLEAVACIGCCALAPCIAVNNETIYGRLTPQKVKVVHEPIRGERKNGQKNHSGQPGNML
ncbi:MAG: NADH-quinone oxidoreductase subunit NuoE [Bacillota bacterium]|nr:NADH-quinone oxidoreductase subunit NuoE [Bacillota bacterium]